VRLGVLLRKDRRVLGNLWRVLRQESLFKVGFILLFAAAMLGGLFALFLDGFYFLASFGGAGFMITRRLFALFFLGLGMMLVLSSVVTAYASLYRSREVPYLLTGPLAAGDIVLYKFIESTALSSWAFFFVILPFVCAYAWHERLGIGFGGWTLLYALPFLVLCSAAGMLTMLAVVRWMPRGRRLGAVLLAAAAAAVYLAAARAARDRLGQDPVFFLARLVPGLKASSWPLMPSWWVAEGIRAVAQGQWARGVMFWCLLTSSAAMGCLAVEGLGRAVFYESLQRLTASGRRARRVPVRFGRLRRVLRPAGRDIAAMMVKDARTFVRDPMQWSQAVIFFGLLALYFLSLRSFRYDRLPYEWRNMIAFLNVFSVAAVLCSLASRFVYPQLSLEGQAFWVVGLSPTTPGRVLAAKFLLAWLSVAAVSTGLILVSTRMLQVEPGVRAVALMLVQAISLAVCGLSTGLGAVFLDLKKANPAAIVSGFGGTVNLVLSLGFMLAVILPFGFVYHLEFTGRIGPAELRTGLGWITAWTVLLTLAATAAPLAAGRRALANRDY
jgi:ABC-2 type transport system permease protein